NVGPYRRDLRPRSACVPGGSAKNVPGDWRAYCSHVLLLRGGGMNRYRLVHVTEFTYDGPVSESYNQVWLRPRQDDRQSCLSFRLTTDPHSRASSYVDPSGNWVHRFNITAEHRRLRVEAESVVLVQQPVPMPAETIPLTALDDYAEELDEHYDLLAPTSYVPHSPGLLEMVTLAGQQSDGAAGGYARAASLPVHGR